MLEKTFSKELRPLEYLRTGGPSAEPEVIVGDTTEGFKGMSPL